MITVFISLKVLEVVVLVTVVWSHWEMNKKFAPSEKIIPPHRELPAAVFGSCLGLPKYVWENIFLNMVFNYVQKEREWKEKPDVLKICFFSSKERKIILFSKSWQDVFRFPRRNSFGIMGQWEFSLLLWSKAFARICSFASRTWWCSVWCWSHSGGAGDGRLTPRRVGRVVQHVEG